VVAANLEELIVGSTVGVSHSADLELAQRCAAGDPAAWDRFVLEYRPVLYRAADALDRHGVAREVADSLYAELFGVGRSRDGEGERRSLFRYFQGRSSLATWLRAVLAQRYVDRLRSGRRLVQLKDEPLKDDSTAGPGLGPRALAAPASEPDPERSRYTALLASVLARVVSALPPRDRLRLSAYYVQDLTLAQVGRLLQEHEATVSRQLARTRRAIRADVERTLREQAGLDEAQVAECLAAVAADPGPLDLTRLFPGTDPVDQVRERSL
jgi:RNA polymerase sigma factor (sigma-70 family)